MQDEVMIPDEVANKIGLTEKLALSQPINTVFYALLIGVALIEEQVDKSLYSDIKKHLNNQYEENIYLSLEALEKEPKSLLAWGSLHKNISEISVEKYFFLLEKSQEFLQMFSDEQLNEILDKYSIRGACITTDSDEYEFLMANHPINPIEVNNRLYTIWFGTTRKPIDKNNITKGFSNQRDNNVHHGKCDVLIPESHRFGEIGRSWLNRWIKLDFEDDHLKLRKIVPYNIADDFWSDLQKEFAENEGDALVFLHGYNTSFEEAAIRAAQIGFDLRVSGATAFFSWASKGEVNGYPDDAASIEGSEAAITDFLLDFSQKSGASKVHLIAHSMGNRGLIRALDKIQHKLKENSPIPFGQIILAAPDLDVQMFKNLAFLYPKLSERTTLYASPKDKAVGLSKWLHGSQRVGIVPPVTVVDGVDTIEVISNFNLFELGHSYFAEAESILHDIFDLLKHNSSPSNRQRLEKKKTELDEIYWTIG